ncbi:TPA: DUF2061 domain-containing protein [archaeon]|uniref:DUF2061 domain-containing protein n=1 Tax=Candidatus Naiadarchaeum limnaeum TaxID=2756139 RepID=A0A832X5S4_9ARCH|nr:DUF2061 domain-containing protein [Candidatus Naiadarchaeales archaeon SRR2090153.bin1042]HIK00095.1 DUF2061 domain-containing protein [Candidatus Naiadarchaeum limnaeum]
MRKEKKFTYFSTHKRSILKSATFWSVSIAVDLIVFYLIFKQVETSLIVTVVGNLTGFTIYYFHERIWNKLHWGKRAHPHS